MPLESSKNRWRYWIWSQRHHPAHLWCQGGQEYQIQLCRSSDALPYIRTILVLIPVAKHQFDSSWGILLQAYNACVVEHLKCWQHLAHQCARDNIFLFRLRPKGHYHQHMGRDVERTRLNPRLVMSCMYDESFLGHIKRIAKACHSWTMVKERFWQRYLLLLSLRFEEHRSCSRWALKLGSQAQKKFCSITTAAAAPTAGDVTDHPFFSDFISFVDYVLDKLYGGFLKWRYHERIHLMGLSIINHPFWVLHTIYIINSDSSVFGKQSLWLWKFIHQWANTKKNMV